MAVAAMNEVGIDIANEFPKPITKEIAVASDVIISMGQSALLSVFVKPH